VRDVEEGGGKEGRRGPWTGVWWGETGPSLRSKREHTAMPATENEMRPQGGVEQFGAPPQLPANGRHRYNTAECARS